mmetsp:Transcript_126672/g.270245  ORF Transcript_126672/g.270245 Transcript_126672/m.270245 type:complete len:214 (-) Transcript_126672:11-652(-)
MRPLPAEPQSQGDSQILGDGLAEVTVDSCAGLREGCSQSRGGVAAAGQEPRCLAPQPLWKHRRESWQALELLPQLRREFDLLRRLRQEARGELQTGGAPLLRAVVQRGANFREVTANGTLCTEAQVAPAGDLEGSRTLPPATSSLPLEAPIAAKAQNGSHGAEGGGRRATSNHHDELEEAASAPAALATMAPTMPRSQAKPAPAKGRHASLLI